MIQRKFSPLHATRHIWCSTFVLVTLAVLLAACGSGGSTNGSSGPYSPGGSTPTASTSQNTPSTTGGGGYGGGGGSTPTASSSNNILKTATATVNGKSETILTNTSGLTLYYRTSDKPPSTVCTGGCAGAWPPLIVSGSGTPTSAASLPGKLTSVADANGNQVEYNGHPLYTYAGDKSAGQTTGEGVGNVWHVVTPSLT